MNAETAGPAANSDNLALKTILERHHLFPGKTLSFERLHGGITNTNWRVTVEEEQRSYFVKVAGEATSLFIDRDVSICAANQAAQLGIAPRVLHHFPENGVEIHEFLSGYRSCTLEDAGSAAIRSAILAAYREIHAQPLLGYTRTGFDQIHDHVSELRRLKCILPDDCDHLLTQVARAEAAILAAGITLVPCYNDAAPGNYMIDDHLNLKIIDWEYAADNDLLWDLALISFIHSPETRRTLLEEYYGGAILPEVEARLTLYQALAPIKWGLWAILQKRLSSIEFDYAGYSEMLLNYARHNLSQPAWEVALVTVKASSQEAES